MTKKFLLTASFVLVCLMMKAQVFLATGGKCSFFSSTPVEDIDAHTESLNSVLNAASGDIQFKVALTTFHFKKALMQEHFNEKYVESSKYPFATFKGKIDGKIDFKKNGIYEVTATGIFNIHNIDKPHTEKAKLTIKDGNVMLEGEFKVALKDHNIEVPKIVMANIAEIITVKFSCNYSPYKK
jgi:polyisoprenoid-binding protein YceI